MAEFGIIDLTVPTLTTDGEPPTIGATGQSLNGIVGNVDTAVVASALESLREDLASHVTSQQDGLRLAKITFKLSLSAEGKIAFVAKGTAEACIEVVFSTSDGSG